MPKAYISAFDVEQADELPLDVVDRRARRDAKRVARAAADRHFDEPSDHRHINVCVSTDRAHEHFVVVESDLVFLEYVAGILAERMTEI